MDAASVVIAVLLLALVASVAYCVALRRKVEDARVARVQDARVLSNLRTSIRAQVDSVRDTTMRASGISMGSRFLDLHRHLEAEGPLNARVAAVAGVSFDSIGSSCLPGGRVVRVDAESLLGAWALMSEKASFLPAPRIDWRGVVVAEVR